MKAYPIILMLLIVTRPAFCQQVKLAGQVSMHNSKYNTGTIVYVKDAYVTGPFTKADDTDIQGQFVLEFVGMAPGTSVQVQVEKAGLEVVNTYDLQRVIINRKLPLGVYVTTKGQLGLAQTELYEISKKALFAQKDALITKLRAGETESKTAIADLEARFGQEIANRFEAEDLLNAKIEALEERLPEFAQQLAAKNLDFASALYIEAYEHYKKGDIEKAIAVLDDAKLDRSYRQATNNIAEGKKLENIAKDLQEKGLLQINQIIDSYALKADAYKLLFDYRSAAQQYEKIIAIHKTHKFDEAQLAGWYAKAASAYQGDGKYSKALEYSQKDLTVREEVLDAKHPDLANSYNDIASTYVYLGKYNKALEHQQMALTIRQGILDAKHPDLATSYSKISNTDIHLGKHMKALEYQRKALAIRKEILDVDHPDLSESYNSMAFVYRALGEYKKALSYLQKFIDIAEETLDPSHPRLASSYNNIALVYRDLGDYKKALEYNQKPSNSKNNKQKNNEQLVANNLKIKNMKSFTQKNIQNNERIRELSTSATTGNDGADKVKSAFAIRSHLKKTPRSPGRTIRPKRPRPNNYGIQLSGKPEFREGWLKLIKNSENATKN